METTTELLRPQQLFSELGLRENMKVADLGCGAIGLFVFAAARMIGDKGMVYAVDILPSVVERIRGAASSEGLHTIVAVWSNIEIYGATKIPAGSLDAAFLINTLFQSKKHEEMLREACRLIKPGGRLLVVDWKKTFAPLGPPVAMRVEAEVIVALAQKAGLGLDHAFDPGKYHFGLIFSKAEDKIQ